MVKIAHKIERTVPSVHREEPNLRLEFYERDITDGVQAL